MRDARAGVRQPDDAVPGRAQPPDRVAAAWLSPDERLLLGLFDGTRSGLGCIACTEDSDSALDCALCSTRIMMALTIPSARPGHDADPAHIGLTIPN
ncbi:hypothetical protein [Novosphingobium sp. PhB165]|uniref:hypothetical protein n=1 Tax=Novosphingobium sp. PhB165 TaxID=2485105 RepID=UPI0010512850|nr:hypothetical protein [Novosphingobium sp. PhB165]